MSKGTSQKVIILGRVGRDPKINKMQSGNLVTELAVATNESYKDKQSGETQTTTEWHRVVLFGRHAEIAEKYINKGKVIYIEGKLKTSKWTDKEGKDNYTVKIIAENIQLVGGSSGDQQNTTKSMQDNKQKEYESYEFDDGVPF